MNDQSLHAAATTQPSMQRCRIEALAELHRQSDAAFAVGAASYGVITHGPLTQIRVCGMVDAPIAAGGVLETLRGHLLGPSELPAVIMRPRE